jgi:hypothetical protein
MLTIQRLGRAKVHGNSVLNDLVLLEDLIKDMQRASAVEHIVLRDDLEPADDRLLIQNVVVMRNAKADPDSEIFEHVKAVGRHWETGTSSCSERGPSPRIAPGPETTKELLLLRHLGAVGGASTVALARVLAFAAVVAALAAALAFTGVLAFTSMFFFHVLGGFRRFL